MSEIDNVRQGVALSELKQVTQAPDVSKEHLVALAKLCKIIGAYTTAELVAAIVGYARVVLNDNAVQEAFVRANAGLLSRASSPRAEAQAKILLPMPELIDRTGCVLELQFEEESQAIEFENGLELPAPAGKAFPANVEFAAAEAPKP